MISGVTLCGVAIIALAGLLPATIARADCPDGSRALAESEQQAYLSIQQTGEGF